MCEGALIAFVMTRQLEAAGQRVAFLGMMDAWPEENTRSRTMNWLFTYDRQLRNFMRLQRRKKQSFLRQALDRVVGRVRGKLWGTEHSKARAQAMQADASEAMTGALWDERVFPGPSFVPPRVNAPITVLRVKEQPYWRIKDERLGWGDRTNRTVDLHYVDGEHADFMRAPHVQVLARELGIALRKAHATLDREQAVAAAQPANPADPPPETADRPAPPPGLDAQAAPRRTTTP